MKSADERLNPKTESYLLERYNHEARYIFAANWLKAKIPKKGIILDVACGFGYGSDIISEATKCKVEGVDIDKDTVKHAQKTYKVNHLCHFSLGDICSLKNFHNGSIDVVVCFETLEHLSLADAEKALQELYRVLAPKGILIISSPNRFWTRLIHLIKKNPFHLHEYYPDELRKVLEKKKFQYQEAYGQFNFNPMPYLFSGLQKNKLIYKLQRNNLFWGLYTIYIVQK